MLQRLLLLFNEPVLELGRPMIDALAPPVADVEPLVLGTSGGLPLDAFDKCWLHSLSNAVVDDDVSFADTASVTESARDRCCDVAVDVVVAIVIVDRGGVEQAALQDFFAPVFDRVRDDIVFPLPVASILHAGVPGTLLDCCFDGALIEGDDSGCCRGARGGTFDIFNVVNGDPNADEVFIVKCVSGFGLTCCKHWVHESRTSDIDEHDKAESFNIDDMVCSIVKAMVACSIPIFFCRMWSNI